MPNTSDNVKIILGTGAFGQDTGPKAIESMTTVEEAREAIGLFKSYGHNELDTARNYGRGASEALLGHLNLGEEGILVNTKAHPRVPGGFNAENVCARMQESLKALHTEKVNVYFLHAPDAATPLEETLKAINHLYEHGLFEKFGISNYSTADVRKILTICDEKKYIRPTVYQGNYNALGRAAESDGLFSLLRENGVAFHAFSPLGAGLLSGKFKSKDDMDKDEFGRSQVVLRQIYKKWFSHGTYFEALKVLNEAAEKHKMSTVEIALRWIRYHSALSAEHGDAVILGFSTKAQLEQSLNYVDAGKLPDELAEVADSLWGLAGDERPSNAFLEGVMPGTIKRDPASR
ncbi:hypothetical protein YB2330_003245 [Saitoella coloradoensis]